jgi:HK97 family phage major capsid protein
MEAEVKKEYQGETFYREASIDHRSVDEDKRTVQLSFSSEEPVQRYFGIEVLSHDPAHVDLSRFNSGAGPVLADHRNTAQIGIVERAWIEKRKGRAVVRFSRRPEAEAEFQDVIDGIRTNISVGYQVEEMERTENNSDTPTYRAIRWTPMEISTVSIPADVTVGVGRSNQGGLMTTTESTHTRPRQLRRDAEFAKQEIIAMGEVHGFQDEALQALKENLPLEKFRAFVLDKLAERNVGAISQGSDIFSIGLTKSESRQFSLLRAIRCLAYPHERKYHEAARFELECSEAASKNAPTETRGIRVPVDVAMNWGTRTLTAGTATDGAELVGTNLLAGSFVDTLRNLSVTLTLGAQMLPGLVGNVSIPRKTSGATASWIATEGGDAANSEPQFDNITLSPKTIGCYVDMTRNLILQSTPEIEFLIRSDLAGAVATGIDLASLYGSGASGQPTGILNQTGINAPTNFAAATPTWAEVVAMESAVDVDNALTGNLGYAINPALAGTLKTTPKETGYPVYILGEDGDKLNGHKLAVSSQVTVGDVFFGNWEDLVVGMWGGLDIVVDPYSNSKSGTVTIVVHQSVDVGLRHPVSFSFNNDGV